MSNSKLATAALVLAVWAASATAHAGGDVINYGAGISRHGGAAVPVPAPVPVPDTQTGYYVRLDAAYSLNSISRYQANEPRADSVRGDSYLDVFPRFGGGVGYQFNRWFRMDATYDLRSDVKSRGAGVVNYTIPNTAGGGTSSTIAMRDTISDGFKSSNATGLINAYMDMPVAHSFTPYVGAGLGFARHQFSGRTFSRTTTCVDTFDCNPAVVGDQPGATTLTTTAKGVQNNVTMAAAAMAGFSYKVWDNTKLDLGYRFLHLQGYTVTGIGAPENIKVPNQNIHELRAGVRFDIN